MAQQDLIPGRKKKGMVHIKLSPEDQSILSDILENDLSDLRMEIADTDRLDFRNYLKQKKSVLMRTLEQLQASEIKESSSNANAIPNQ